MKKLLLLCLISILSISTYTQELKEKKEDLDFMFRVEYHVLKSNKKVKQGMYTLFSKSTNKVAVRGNYDNNLLSGTWMFFDYKGNLEQRFNFSEERLLFNQPKIENNSIEYQFPIEFSSKDTLKAPIKIGGLFYGYSFFNLPSRSFSDYMTAHSINKSKIKHYLTIDRNGYLVGWKSVLEADGKIFEKNVKSVPEFFKLFIPAYLNNEKTEATIVYTSVLSVSKTVSTTIRSY